MSDIRVLSLQRIQGLCDEAEKAAMDIQQKALFPSNYPELKFEEVCQISHKLREIKQWAEAIGEIAAQETSRKQMNWFTDIELWQWKKGDVLLFKSDKENGPLHDTVCIVKTKGIIVTVEHGLPVVVGPNWKCKRINHKYISDGTWYVKGTEAFPVCEPWGNEAHGWVGLFVGWTDEGFKGYNGQLPCWDGEVCAYDEFEITER